MKSVLTFWVAGCAITGIASGLIDRECPYDPRTTERMERMVIFTAIWPAFIVNAVVYAYHDSDGHPVPTMPLVCSVKSK